MLYEKVAANLTYQTYLNRFFIHEASKKEILPLAKAYIIIPVYAEEHLIDTLLSLKSCHSTSAKITLIWVVNCKATDEEIIQNLATENLNLLRQWSSQPDFLPSLVLDCRNLEDKNAGVGLARKIGMDLVIFNLRNQAENPWLICLDGDCRVANHYLQTIENELIKKYFEVATFEFTHFFPSGFSPRLKEGIDQYELFLEYYRLGLYKAGFPFPHHTVGSSMACLAAVYAKSGGMNQRKAGEDFYFLHKLFPHYKTLPVSGPMVYPSARISERVPFGTGRFQKKWMESDHEKWKTYHPEIFSLMKIYLESAISFLCSEKENPEFAGFLALHPESKYWLKTSDTEIKLMQCKNASPSLSARKKAFFCFFDGFQALKMVHFFQPFFNQIPVEDACLSLLPELNNMPSIPEKVHFIRKFLTQNIRFNYY